MDRRGVRAVMAGRRGRAGRPAVRAAAGAGRAASGGLVRGAPKRGPAGRAPAARRDGGTNAPIDEPPPPAGLYPGAPLRPAPLRPRRRVGHRGAAAPEASRRSARRIDAPPPRAATAAAPITNPPTSSRRRTRAPARPALRAVPVVLAVDVRVGTILAEPAARRARALRRPASPPTMSRALEPPAGDPELAGHARRRARSRSAS